MPEVINTIFKLKRGTEARWAEVNPVLAQGEPGFVYDKNKLKIGDGITPWNNLPYIEGQTGIVNYDYVSEFPSVGHENLIYKAEKEQSIYQYNSETEGYEKLSSGAEIDDITIINGGKA